MFAKQGLKIITGIEIGDVKISQKGVSIDYTDKDGNEQKLDADRLIVSIGRIPNTDGLDADKVGLKLTDRGQIEVDAHCRTNLPGVWAVGDVVAGPMLAHKAMEEGVMVAEIMAGQAGHCNFDTDSLGDLHQSGDRLGRQDRAAAEGRRRCLQGRQDSLRRQWSGARHGRPERLCQDACLCHHRPHSRRPYHRRERVRADLRGVVAMEFGAASEDLARICHAHPTLSEVVHEAALACDKRPLHF
jgi:dihydrolipoamide dehydrogenase